MYFIDLQLSKVSNHLLSTRFFTLLQFIIFRSGTYTSYRYILFLFLFLFLGRFLQKRLRLRRFKSDRDKISQERRIDWRSRSYDLTS